MDLRPVGPERKSTPQAKARREPARSLRLGRDSSRGEAARLQRVLNEPFKQRIRNRLLERMALGLDDLPVPRRRVSTNSWTTRDFPIPAVPTTAAIFPAGPTACAARFSCKICSFRPTKEERPAVERGAPAAHATDPDDLVTGYRGGESIQQFRRQGYLNVTIPVARVWLDSDARICPACAALSIRFTRWTAGPPAS